MMIDCTRTMAPLPHMWSKCIGAGRACEGLRAQWQEQLRIAKQECGFEYIRFHGLLAEDMFACQEVNGAFRYNWAYVDALFDFLMDVGVRPFVEFGFMPPVLASGEQTQFWWRGNVTPPHSFEQWSDLVGALVLHWKERYGLDEIRQWYYEVWNEPNLPVFWGGTKSEYFELYRYTVKAVKQVDGQLRVGGPATSNFVPDDRFSGEREDVSRHLTHKIDDLDSVPWHGVWIEEFLSFCQREKLPVDFVSAHPYPTDFALDGLSQMRGRSRGKDSLYADMCWLQQAVRNSAYPHAQICLTEWSSSPSPRDCSHDWLPAANYIIHSNLNCHGLADALSYWVFTDIFEENGGGPEAFHGGFGLMNMQGVKKPAYHAYRFLHRLGNEIVAREEEGIITLNEKGMVQGLWYNYAKDLKEAIPIAVYPDHDKARRIQQMGEKRAVNTMLTGLRPGTVFILERMAHEDTAIGLWDQMGRPANLSRMQEAALKAVGPHRQTLTADEKGTLNLCFSLKPWEIVCLYQVA